MMKPNPGGMLALKDIVGRDSVVAYLQAVLDLISACIGRSQID